MQISKVLLLGTVSLCCLSVPAYAGKIPSNHLIHIEQFGGSNLFENVFSNNSTDSTYNHELISDVRAYGDLTTGRAGSISSSTNGTSYQSIVEVYDTLTFSSATEVSFNFTLHGFLSSNSVSHNPKGQGRVDIYDITGIDNWLETGSLFGLVDQVDVVSDATELSANTVEINMNKVQGFTTDTGEISEDNNLLRDGSLHEVNRVLSGSFSVDPTKTYGIRLAVNTYSSGGSVADFSGTGTFEFTDLGGASFNSDSGTFLTAAPVPVPASMLLFGTGIAGLLGTRIRRKKK